MRQTLPRTPDALTVLGEPLSEQQGVMDNLPVASLAGEWLDELRTDMDPDEFAESKAQGTARTYELAMKEMIEQAPRH